MTFLRLLTLGLVTFGMTGAAAHNRLELRATPRVSFAPGNLTIRATVDPSDQYRSIEVVADSTNYYRSSEVELDGARAPRVTVFEFDNVPRGVYAVTAALKDARGEIVARVDQQVQVIESARVN